MSNPSSDSVDNLVAVLDNLMSNGGGHVNVVVDDESGELAVETVNSTDCSLGKGACAQPTELSTDED